MSVSKVEILREMEYAVTHIRERVLDEKARGHKVIGCLPILIPEELVHASGAFPVGIWGAERLPIVRAAEYSPPYACSVVQSITELAIAGAYDGLDGVLISCLCDTLKCVTQSFPLTCPSVKPIFVKHPQNHRLEGAVTYFIRELEGVRAQLETLTGRQITEEALCQSIEIYNENRKEMIAFARLLAEKPGLLTCRERHTVIKARYFMRKEEHTRLMRELNGMLCASTAPSFEGIKVYVSGVMLEPSHILDVMDELGYTIVGDELAHESRQFNHLVPEALSQLERLARQVQTYEGEAFLYDPRKTRGERVARAAKEAGADAVLFALMKFCDTDEYDLPWVRCAAQEADLPFLHLELEQTMQSAEPLRTRLQAFAEQLTHTC